MFAHYETVKNVGRQFMTSALPGYAMAGHEGFLGYLGYIDIFIVRALTAGLLVALLTGALGVFIVWRRMAYFGDTVSHASLLGVSLGFLLGISVNVGIIAISLSVALLMVVLQRKRGLSNDTLLGILAHSALSLGLVVLTFVEGVRVDLNAWLFGDILAVTNQDLIIFGVVTVFVLGILYFIWRPLLSLTVHEDLARVEGVNVTLISITYTLLIALTIAVGMKVIGALLISSMLIIPAAAARKLANSPGKMVIMAMLIGMLSVSGGLMLSYFWDTPAGPSIVVVSSFIFAMLHVLPLQRTL